MLIPLLISAAVLLLLFLTLRWLYDRFWQKGLSCRMMSPERTQWYRILMTVEKR